MGHPPAGLGLGEDHVLHTDAGEDPAVLGREGLGPDGRDARVDQVEGRQDGGLDG